MGLAIMGLVLWFWVEELLPTKPMAKRFFFVISVTGGASLVDSFFVW